MLSPKQGSCCPASLICPQLSPCPTACATALQVSDVYAQLVDPSSKAGAALRKALPGGTVPDHTQLFHPGEQAWFWPS